MTLTDLITVTCFFMPFGGAFSFAKRTHAGIGGYVLVILLAIVLGVAFAWLHRSGVQILVQYFLSKSSPAKKWITFIVTSCYFLWSFTLLVLSAMAGDIVAEHALPFVA